MTTQGIILFAHGSRDPLWHQPIEAVAKVLRERQPDVQVSCAYLELSSPDLMDAAFKMIANGARQIRVFPLFLGVGKHAREDLPALIGQLRALHPGISVELLPAAGEYPQLTGLLADIALS